MARFKMPQLLSSSMPADRLVDQFYVTLLAAQDRIGRRADPGSSPVDTAGVRELLAQEPRCWRTAYHVEQLLVHHYTLEEMEMEMERRLVDAEALLPRDVYGAYAKAKGRLDAQRGPELRRMELGVLLGRLVNDLQWRYELMESKREYQRQLSSRTALLFIWVFLIFMTYVIVATGMLFTDTDSGNVAQVTQQVNQLVRSRPVAFYFFTVGLAVVAGCLGACFSMLTGLKPRLAQSTLDDLKILHASSNLVTRALIGICAGLIIFYFIRAGLLTGPLVPDLIVRTDAGYDLFTAMALLVVWCFLGGFSEKLVPALLSKTEGQAGVVGAPSRQPQDMANGRRSGLDGGDGRSGVDDPARQVGAAEQGGRTDGNGGDPHVPREAEDPGNAGVPPAS